MERRDSRELSGGLFNRCKKEQKDENGLGFLAYHLRGKIVAPRLRTMIGSIG